MKKFFLTLILSIILILIPNQCMAVAGPGSITKETREQVRDEIRNEVNNRINISNEQV